MKTPSSKFGGTWVSWGAGKFIVGVNSSDSSFNTVEKTEEAKLTVIRLRLQVNLHLPPEVLDYQYHKYLHINITEQQGVDVLII